MLISFSPLPSAASAEPLFVEANLRKQMRAEECPARGAVPRIVLHGCGGRGMVAASIVRGRAHRQAGVQQGLAEIVGHGRD
jgi:beta-glucuronosyltransferase